MRVDVEHARKRFGSVVALDGVSFAIESGSRVALVGPNGSGKSTLNRVLMGLVACEGRVRIDGHCPFRERVAVARRMAYVPQIAPQLGAPADEVIAAVARVRDLARERVAALARALDLDLDAIGRRPFRSLSGGMRQKLLIALAFATDAGLLILDEPTGSLDARARERVFELFDALGPDVTLVLCSHRLEEIRPLVDHVLMLEEGRVAYDGPVRAFLEKSALATIDVWATGIEAETWLAAHGFRRQIAGAWRCTTDPASKLRLLAEIPAALGDQLDDLNARDVEALDLAAAPRRTFDA
jgi:ABC-type multidrug transport system ATPase subunit